MTAQAATALYQRGATFELIAQQLRITERAAIDSVTALLDLDHCPRCGQLKAEAEEWCEDCEGEGQENAMSHL